MSAMASDPPAFIFLDYVCTECTVLKRKKNNNGFRYLLSRARLVNTDAILGKQSRRYTYEAEQRSTLRCNAMRKIDKCTDASQTQLFPEDASEFHSKSA